MNRILVAASGLLLAALTAAPVRAAPEGEPAACRQAPLSSLQKRLLDKSEQGVEALRQFLFNVRAIHPLGLVETADWVAAQREAARQCLAARAAAEAAEAAAAGS
jgi:hypothetical protein